MTLAVENPRIAYSASAGQTTFPYPFRIFAAADLEVYVDNAIQSPTLYSVTNVGADGGGNVIFNSGITLAEGQQVVIVSDIDKLQLLEFISGDPFPAADHEEGLDRLTRLIQQVCVQLDRTLRYSVGQTSVNPTNLILPIPLEPGGYLRVNGAGTGYVYNVVDPPQDLIVNRSEAFVSTAGQTVFTLTDPYTPGAGELLVFVNGVRQGTAAFTETNTTTVTFSVALPIGQDVEFVRLFGVSGSNPLGPTTGTVTTQVEEFVTVLGQTNIFLAIPYTPGTGELQVYLNGARQLSTAFTEVSANLITFNSPLGAGDNVLVDHLTVS